MKVLVDTSVWSLVFRKKELNSFDEMIIRELKKLLNQNSCVIIGAIRQEILSGIASTNTFRELALSLQSIPNLETKTDIYVKAAEYFNTCRKHGIQGSHIDFLICAVSIHYKLPIFTLDKDFDHYKKYLPLNIYNYYE